MDILVYEVFQTDVNLVVYNAHNQVNGIADYSNHVYEAETANVHYNLITMGVGGVLSTDEIMGVQQGMDDHRIWLGNSGQGIWDHSDICDQDICDQDICCFFYTSDASD